MRPLIALLLPAAVTAWLPDYFYGHSPYSLSPYGGHHVAPSFFDSPFYAPRVLDDFGSALRRMQNRAEVATLMRGLMGELDSAIARLDKLEGELNVTRDDEGGVTVSIAGMASEPSVEIDENVLKISGTSADGKTTIRRSLGLPRRVVDADLVTANVENEKLVIKVPHTALEPPPRRIQSKIEVKHAGAIADKAAAEGSAQTS